MTEEKLARLLSRIQEMRQVLDTPQRAHRKCYDHDAILLDVLADAVTELLLAHGNAGLGIKT